MRHSFLFPLARGTTPRFLRRAALLIGLLCLLGAGRAVAQEADALSSAKEEDWVAMPAGNRATFVGIHGGTVPVTLFSSEDGSMMALPGASGQDFLKILHGAPVQETAPQEDQAVARVQQEKMFSAPVQPWLEKNSGTRQWTPLGFKPALPHELLQAQARRLKYEAEQRSARLKALAAWKRQNKVFPQREKTVFPSLKKILHS